MYFREKIRQNIWCIFLEQTWIFITFFMTWYMNDDYTYKIIHNEYKKKWSLKKSKPYLWTINHRIMYVYKKTGPSHISYLILIFGIQIRYNKRKYFSEDRRKNPLWLVSCNNLREIALFFPPSHTKKRYFKCANTLIYEYGNLWETSGFK